MHLISGAAAGAWSILVSTQTTRRRLPKQTQQTKTNAGKHKQWRQGYTERFGVVHVDFNGGTLARTPKRSALWLAEHFFGPGAA